MEISRTEHSADRILIRRSSFDDLPHLFAISQTASEAAHWTEQQWRDIFHTQNPPRIAWTALEAGGTLKHPADAQNYVSTGESPHPIGFLVAQCGGPDWELENMAVVPESRGRGAGSALLGALLAEARSQGAERILLEVRPSNQAAIRLYQRGRFQLLARRPGYYRDPAEDALILARFL